MALSRARLGLYILGRREVFDACYELREAFELLFKRPSKLTLVTGELWPSERTLAEEVDKELPGEAVMEGVEHLGEYVVQMTKTKIEQLRTERGLPPVEEASVEAIPAIEPEQADGEDGSADEEEADEEERTEEFAAEE